MWESFIVEVQKQIKETVNSEGQAIKKAAAVLVETIEMDGIIHTFGSGHSALVAQEIFCRAGGIVPVNAILDPSFMVSYGARRVHIGASVRTTRGVHRGGDKTRSRDIEEAPVRWGRGVPTDII